MPQPPPAQQLVEGTVDRVPCPHCGGANDFREIVENLTSSSSFGEAQETGQKIICDHCDKPMEVVRIRRLVMIGVKQAK